MERVVFDRMAELDQTHWWYVGRRQILADIVSRVVLLPTNAKILEIGCGTGHNFAMLSQFGQIDGIEIDDTAREIASQRLGRPVGFARLPQLEGIADESYDLIALLDVLEHVSGDEEALNAIAKKLKPNGRLLLTVPANRWMWSAHDRIHHHFRRYNRRDLESVIGRTGLRVVMLSHFNTILFPFAAAVRFFGRLTGRNEADDTQPAGPINVLLTRLFGFERHLVARVPLPFGVSLVAVLSRQSGKEHSSASAKSR